MKRIAACLGMLVCSATAFGGIATFNPSPVIIDPAVSTTANVGVTVAAGPIEALQTVDMIIGSDSLNITGFAYDAAFVAGSAFRLTPIVDGSAVYANTVQLGGFLNAATPSVLVGLVGIDAAGLAPGEYELLVNGDRDQGISALGSALGDVESLSGRVLVQVVPEPATLLILGAAGLGVVFRRRN